MYKSLNSDLWDDNAQTGVRHKYVTIYIQRYN